MNVFLISFDNQGIRGAYQKSFLAGHTIMQLEGVYWLKLRKYGQGSILKNFRHPLWLPRQRMMVQAILLPLL